MKGLVAKTAGVAHVLRSSLRPFQERIKLAFLHGSAARGAERTASDIDILIVADVRFTEIVEAFGPAQERLGRKINPTVYTLKEFRENLAAGHHFLCSVAKNPKRFIVGDERVFERLAEKRPAG